MRLVCLQIMRVLKSFYDLDIVADSIIVAWHNARRIPMPALCSKAQQVQQARRIRRLAKPYIDYLEEDSEEDTDTEEE